MIVQEYYNDFKKKLVLDYINNNPRVESSILEMLRKAPVNAQNILDIGCGIGWSSYAMHTNFPDKQISAIDLSKVLIETANILFRNPSTEFVQADVTDADFFTNTSFDYVVMIDVFEHIPSSERISFINHLNRITKNNCRFYFSCPTVYHQNFLKVNNPSGLQPIDEEIDLNVMIDFAKKINGEITFYNFVSIWNTNDYFHCVIDKKVEFEPDHKKSFNYQVESRDQRIERVLNTKIKDIFSAEEINLFLKKPINQQSGSLKRAYYRFFKSKEV
jgi:SAM-dependent methyltransferase